MDIKAFEYMNAIVEFGSISKAADNLFISQPALSQYLSNLESDLNVKLLNRDGRKLTLTPAGEIFLRSGNQILQMYTAMCNSLEDSAHKDSVTIRIGVSPFYAQYYMPKIIPAFTRIHPEARFVIFEKNFEILENLLVSGEIDICLLPYYQTRGKLDYTVLRDDEVILALPGNSPLNAYGEERDGKKYMNLSHLKDADFVLHPDVDSFSMLTLGLCEERGFTPKAVCSSNAWGTVNMLVQKGVGAAFLIDLCTDAAMPDPAPSYYHIVTERSTKRPFAAVTNPSAKNPPVISELIEFLKEFIPHNQIG